jgi:hypothetical protein
MEKDKSPNMSGFFCFKKYWSNFLTKLVFPNIEITEAIIFHKRDESRELIRKK